MPEIDLSFGPAGRDTLSAISEDARGVAEGARFQASSPDLTFDLTVAGRDTLATIAKEAAEEAKLRVAALNVNDAPLKAVQPSMPEITISEGRAGMKTLDAIAEELAPEPTTGVRRRSQVPEGEDGRAQQNTLDAIADAMMNPAGSVEAIEAFEMATFVLRGKDMHGLATAESRRKFVEERLLHRVPAAKIDDVVRVDLTPWTAKNTVILRVWCRVPPPPKPRGKS